MTPETTLAWLIAQLDSTQRALILDCIGLDEQAGNLSQNMPPVNFAESHDLLSHDSCFGVDFGVSWHDESDQ